MAGQQLRLPHDGTQAVEPQQDGRVLRRGEKMRLALLALRMVAVLTQTVAVQPEKADGLHRLVQHVGADEAADKVSMAQSVWRSGPSAACAHSSSSASSVSMPPRKAMRGCVFGTRILPRRWVMCSGFSANAAPSGVR